MVGWSARALIGFRLDARHFNQFSFSCLSVHLFRCFPSLNLWKEDPASEFWVQGYEKIVAALPKNTVFQQAAPGTCQESSGLISHRSVVTRPPRTSSAKAIFRAGFPCQAANLPHLHLHLPAIDRVYVTPNPKFMS